MRVRLGRATIILMPRILITTEPGDAPDAAVMLSERLATSDLASDHFAAQLIQRISWALADAESNERDPIEHTDAGRREAFAGAFMQAPMLAPAGTRPGFA
jgi:hypothetical protein